MTQEQFESEMNRLRGMDWQHVDFTIIAALLRHIGSDDAEKFEHMGGAMQARQVVKLIDDRTKADDA